MKRNCLLLLLLMVFVLMKSGNVTGQPITIGFRDSIKSLVLNETRKIIIGLPENYDSTDKSYPVLYRLDGDKNLFIETVGIVSRLVYHEEIMPEIIVVGIENTDRMRDMWPGRSEAGPLNFQKFLDTELVPYMDKKYRTSKEKILCGQSVSSAFTLYSFLKNTGTFNAFIACSAGFPGGEDFYFNLANKKLNSNLFKEKTLFMTNGLSDPYDAEQKIHGNSFNLFKLIESTENINCKYVTYEDEGHVPFQSLYHGLKFIYEFKSVKE